MSENLTDEKCEELVKADGWIYSEDADEFGAGWLHPDKQPTLAYSTAREIVTDYSLDE